MYLDLDDYISEKILMKRIFMSLLMSLISLSVIAEEPAKELPPLNPAYEGMHKMVLMNHSSSIFATNISTYKRPGDVQLLYKMEVKDVALVQLVRDNDLITVKTKSFNLERLVRGEEVSVEADIYLGHFDRDGMLVYEGMTLNFSKKLYSRKLEDLKESSNNQEYDVVDSSGSNKIFIHRIQQPPTYAHIIHIDLDAGCLSKFRTSSAVPKRTELQYKFLNCGTMKPFYYETEDFKEK